MGRVLVKYQMPDRDYPALTDRELTILLLIAAGHSNKDIAAQVSLSLGTVKWYVHQIFEKLNVRRRTQAVAVARERGLLGDTPSGESDRSRLPTALTPFFGREQELSQVEQLLADPKTRLISIVGPGGIGKTRLALEIAHRQVAKGEVCFVALEAVTSPDDVVQTIAEAVGLQSQGNGKVQLLTYLQSRELLLVLDNFEHLLEAAPLVTEMLSSTAKLTVVVTSRERLNLQAETVYTLRGLAYPQGLETLAAYSAFQVFIQGACRVLPHYQPNEEDQWQIIRICQLVEGMPLALELAAAWMDVLTPEQIAREIEKGIGILRTSARDIPERHRSIQAVFEQTWSMMTEGEQPVFAKFAVFRGGFDQAAARQVTGASLFQLSTLVDKTLVTRTGSDRFKLHELLLQFAWKKLRVDRQVEHQARTDHMHYYLTYVQHHSYSQSYAENANIWTAWDWAVEEQAAEVLVDVAAAMFQYCYGNGLVRQPVLGFGKGVERLRDTATTQIERLALAWMFIGQGYFLNSVDVQQGREHLEGSLRLLDQLPTPNPLAKAYALASLCRAAQVEGDMIEAQDLALESLKLFNELDHPFGQWGALSLLFNSSYELGNYTKAKHYLTEAAALSERLAEPGLDSAIALWSGIVDIELGEFETARAGFLNFLQAVRQRRWQAPPHLTMDILAGTAAIMIHQGLHTIAVEMLGVVVQSSFDYVPVTRRASERLAELEGIVGPDEFHDALASAQAIIREGQRSRTHIAGLPLPFINRVIALLEE